MGTAVNIKSRENRQSVISALKSIQSHLKLYREVPENGLVIFSGEAYDDDLNREKKILTAFEPIQSLSYSMYICDKQFHTDKLMEQLTSNEKRIGFIIVDGKGALFAALQNNSREILAKYTVDLPRKHGRGGQSSNRFANIREEKRHNYLHKLAETAVACFIEKDKINVAGLILGGCAELKQELGESNLLDPRIKAKILKYVDLSYGMELGLNAAINQSLECLRGSDFIIEKETLIQFFDEIAKQTNLYCFGAVETLDALESGAVKILIIWEDLDIYRYKLRDKTGKESISYARKGKNKNFVENIEIKEVECELLLDWLVENYKRFGATIQIVTDKSQEGSQFCKGFGGIGGIKLTIKQIFFYRIIISSICVNRFTTVRIRVEWSRFR